MILARKSAGRQENVRILIAIRHYRNGGLSTGILPSDIRDGVDARSPREMEVESSRDESSTDQTVARQVLFQTVLDASDSSASKSLGDWKSHQVLFQTVARVTQNIKCEARRKATR